jgi:hypothetical protein
MSHVRKHIALQLHRGAVYVEEYDIPKPKPPETPVAPPRTPSAPPTEDEMDAANILLHLPMPGRRTVRFSRNVAVQEFESTTELVDPIEFPCTTNCL